MDANKELNFFFGGGGRGGRGRLGGESGWM